jgi:hypothetical protein
MLLDSTAVELEAAEEDAAICKLENKNSNGGDGKLWIVDARMLGRRRIGISIKLLAKTVKKKKLECRDMPLNL